MSDHFKEIAVNDKASHKSADANNAITASIITKV